MRTEKVVFPEAKPKLRVKKKQLVLPIELYYSKISEVYMLIGLIIGMATTFPILATIPDLSDNIWFGLITLILVLVIIYKVVDFCKSMQYENPNIVIEKDCLYLLYDDYVIAEFDKMESIEISDRMQRGGKEYFLTMTVAKEHRTKGKYVHYSMKYGYLYVNGKSIDAYQAFDLIWQAFWNYHEETNHPLRIRNKEEWEWWE